MAWLLQQKPSPFINNNSGQNESEERKMSNTILFVDGSREYLESLVDFFSKRDFETMGASTFEEAKTLLRTKKVDIAVMEYTVRPKDGHADTFSDIMALAAEHETAVIIMSDQQSPVVERRIRQIGPAFYFAKPFAIDNLYAVVLRVFDSRDKNVLRKRKQRAAA